MIFTHLRPLTGLKIHHPVPPHWTRREQHTQKHDSELSAYLIGRIARSTAFSWTCQPNMKELKAQRTRHWRKPRGPCGLHHRQKTEG